MQKDKNPVSRVMLVSVVTNIFLAVMKIISGIIFSSSAIIADGVHSFSDLMTDFFAIMGGYFARKPADKEHPYGHGNIEYLTSLLISIVILIVGGSVIYNGIMSETKVSNALVIIVSIITIIIKLLLSSYILRKGKFYNNSILLASGHESRGDVISSIVVLISSILIQFSGYLEILKYTEKIACVIVGSFILIVGYRILSDNISILLGRQEDNDHYMEKLRNLILSNKEVEGIQELLVLRRGPVSTLNLTVYMNGDISLREAHNACDKLEKQIHEFSHYLKYVHVHMEPCDKKDEE